MRVLITGGSGLVGRNLRAHPRAQAHDILAPRSNELNLLDSAATTATVAAMAPDLIIHAAGRVGGIQANMAQPVEFLVDNADMGRNILMAAKSARIPRVLNIGSSCMYPRDAENPLCEDQIGKGELEPTNEGYALAKLMAARLADYITATSHLSYKTLIPCNLFGYFDKFDPAVSHLLPAIIRKVYEAKAANAPSVEIWGDGTARREFMFGQDMADGVWWAAESFDDLPNMLNLGLGHDHSVNDYYATAARVIGWEGHFTHDLSRPTGMAQKLTDVGRATALGWQAQTSLEEAIAATYQHFLEHHS
ncbi:NAD-dependent epimerase/dehydratase family protein [Thalassobacter sp. 16PALIMAR09]|uniref:NAD-dependent epimerase/dehydratase family protein n=1 Tax=Thalassobacter sp. 16PALIMAR09 TaxID=1225651 RepID=UPI00051DB94C|nr:NAD-dependent epimerase/dehydratase family protein [Thalassobacter sp. 16PALIMAR09]KGK99924.1 nodulation protein NolK [Thalassobacter sp. 16PALIMAR09]